MTAIAPADHAAYLDWLRAQLEQAIIPLDDAAWEDARNRNSISDYSAYLQRFPNPRHRPEAIQKIAAIEAIETASWEGARQANALQGYAAYLYRYPYGRYRDAAIQARDQRLREMQEARRRTAPQPGGRLRRVLLPMPRALIGRRAIRTIRVSKHPVDAVAVGLDGQYAVSLDHEGIVKVWDLATTKIIREIEGLHAYWLTLLPGDDVGPRVLSGGHEKFQLWDLKTGKTIRVFNAHPHWPRCCAVSPDGRHAITGSERSSVGFGENTIRLWDLESGETIRTFEGHSQAISSVAISPNGHHVLSSAGTDAPHLWSIQTGKLIRKLEEYKGLEISSVAITPDGRHGFVGGTWSKAFRLWDLETGRIIRTFEARPGCDIWDGIVCVAITPDGLNGLSAHNYTGTFGAGILRVWDLQTGEERSRFNRFTMHEKAWRRDIRDFAISPDGQFVVSANADGTISLWDIHK